MRLHISVVKNNTKKETVNLKLSRGYMEGVRKEREGINVLQSQNIIKVYKTDVMRILECKALSTI